MEKHHPVHTFLKQVHHKILTIDSTKGRHCQLYRWLFRLVIVTNVDGILQATCYIGNLPTADVVLDSDMTGTDVSGGDVWGGDVSGGDVLSGDVSGGDMLVLSESNADVRDDDTSTNTVIFTNKYQVSGTTYTMEGSKVLEGRAIREGEFVFELYETDSSFVIPEDAAPKYTTLNSGNSFAFDGIEYTQVGTYYYAVKEKASSLPGVSYDTVLYQVTVTVGVDQAGTGLTATAEINKIGHNRDSCKGMVFVNTYVAQPAEYILGGSKVLHGRALKAGEFSFELYNGETKIDTARNKYDGSFAFGPITYPEAGTYTYIIKEVKGDVPRVSYDGVDKPVTVTVQVTDTNGKLEAVAKIGDTDISNADIKFENTYKTVPEKALKKDVFSAADPVESIDGKKVSEGDELLYRISYSNITDKTADIKITDRIPANTTYVVGSADNAGAYGNGTMVWDIKNIPAWATVTVAFKVTVNSGIGAVTIKNQAVASDGTNSYETEIVTNYTVDETEDTNTATPNIPDAPINIPVALVSPATGDDSNLWIWFVLLFICGGGLGGIVLYGKKKKSDEK